MNFVGRKKELDILQKEYESNDFRFILLKGRRRIGKSELIAESLRRSEKKSIYFQAVEGSLESNLLSLDASIGAFIKHDEERHYNSLEELLEGLFRHSLQESFIFIIDEYPYLRDCYKAQAYLDSYIQKLIDKYKNISKMKFIISGSSVKIMNSIIKKDSALFGRVDTTISLSDMNYYEASGFYPSYSPEEKFMAYAAFGGSPYLSRLVDTKMGVKDNIIQNILSNSSMSNYASDILSKELKNLALANTVFGSIATGTHNFSDFLKRLGKASASSLDYALKVLEEMGLIRKVVPINKGGESKRTFYYIADFYLHFFYRYMYRNASSLQIMDKGQFYDYFIEKDLKSAYLPKVFEEIARQYLIKENIAGKFDPPFIEIGKYWYDDPINKTNGEFDVVGKNALGEYLFLECKYSASPLSKRKMEREIEQTKALKLKRARYGFVSKSGYEDGFVDPFFLTLLDLYK